MTRKTWKIPTVIIGICKDCAFYNDCPAEYLCPCAELITEAVMISNDPNDEPEEQWDDNFCNPFNYIRNDEE